MKHKCEKCGKKVNTGKMTGKHMTVFVCCDCWQTEICKRGSQTKV